MYTYNKTEEEEAPPALGRLRTLYRRINDECSVVCRRNVILLFHTETKRGESVKYIYICGLVGGAVG